MDTFAHYDSKRTKNKCEYNLGYDRDFVWQVNANFVAVCFFACHVANACIFASGIVQ